jgi:pyruvate,water dikinase
MDKTQFALVGGKGINLGELAKMEGIQVPEGFCVTTEGYKEAIGRHGQLQSLLEQLNKLKIEDRDQIGKVSELEKLDGGPESTLRKTNSAARNDI